MTNETDLLGDTDDLRSILHSRAALAPNPDALIPATRPLARRRRLRRHGAVFGGVVVLTTLALLGAALLRSVEAPVIPTGPPLIPPVFPFSVGPLPDGLVLDGWSSMGNDLTLQPFIDDDMSFGGPHANGDVHWTNSDPALTVIPTSITRTTVTVHGVPAVVTTGPTGDFNSVSWPVAPERWVNVILQAFAPNVATESMVLAIAEAVRARPSSPPTTLDIAHLPAGFRAFSWQHGTLRGVTEDDVELCPTTMAKSSGERSCFTVVTASGSRTTTRIFFGNHIKHVRWIRDKVWVGVYPDHPTGIRAAEVDALLREVSVG